MPERGDTLATRVALLEDKVTALTEAINSGPNVPWSKSLRGRMHDLEKLQWAADNLGDAAREMRRTNVMIPKSIFAAIAGTIAAMAALVAVVAGVVTYWP